MIPLVTSLCLYWTLMFWIIPWSMGWVADVVLGEEED
jgi:hypothetical protein